jgi:uncharacterized protein
VSFGSRTLVDESVEALQRPRREDFEVEAIRCPLETLRTRCAEHRIRCAHAPPDRIGGIVKLSTIERLLLYNQYEILKRLSTDEHERESYERFQTIVERGYEGESESLAWIDTAGVLPAEECNFVKSVLDMYWIMQRHAEWGGFDIDGLEFPGFDGNNETSHMSYAKFVLDDPRTFEGFRMTKSGINSHWPRIDQYARMLPVYKEALRARDGDYLSEDAIRAVLAVK